MFNQSRYTWSFGSPDILPMFAQNTPQVETIMYESELEDFGSDGSHLDTWVFDKVEEMFDRARTNSTLYNQLKQDKVVFFLHLLGLDTNGHAHKPFSHEYLDNIKLVASFK